jgi:hypothetical protein
MMCSGLWVDVGIYLNLNNFVKVYRSFGILFLTHSNQSGP